MPCGLAATFVPQQPSKKNGLGLFLIAFLICAPLCCIVPQQRCTCTQLCPAAPVPSPTLWCPPPPPAGWVGEARMQLQACGHPMLVAWAGLGANWCCKHQGHLQTCQGPVVYVGPRCWPQRWWHGGKPRALACWAGHAPTRQKPSRADNAPTTGCTLRLAPLLPMVRGCTSLQPKPTHGCCGGHCQGTARGGPTGQLRALWDCPHQRQHRKVVARLFPNSGVILPRWAHCWLLAARVAGCT